MEAKMNAMSQRRTVTRQVPPLPLFMKQVQFPPPAAQPCKPTSASRVSPESLSKEWQLRLQAIEFSLGKRLSQEAVTVLTLHPEAERVRVAVLPLASHLLFSLKSDGDIFLLFDVSQFVGQAVEADE